jgi:cyclic-di-GMP phosphodiesterase TipF (flagellum assembly factor)
MGAIAVSLVIIALGTGATLLLWISLAQPPALSAAAGFLVALVAGLLARAASRPKATAEPQQQPAARDDGPAVADQIKALVNRIDRLERQVLALDESVTERTRVTARAVAAELDTIGAVVRQLAEAVALHDAELFAEPRQAMAAASPVEVIRAGQGAAVGEATAPEPEPQPAPVRPEPFPAPPALDAAAKERLQALLSRAFDEARFELQLQSVVTLPQRKVRVYEARHVLRGDDGQISEQSAFMPEAEALGRSGLVDRLLIARALRVIRHLKARRRDVALLCRISARSFLDPAIFDELVEFARLRREDAEQVLLAIDQSSYQRLGALELESIEALKQLGLRFVLDDVADLRLDARQLGERGFRMVKVRAELLLAAERGIAATEIHAADLAGLLSRYGVSLIATGITTEKTVLDLLDYAIPLAQGDLFAPARPVRLDVLEAETRAQAAPAQPGVATTAPAAPRPEETRTSFRSVLRRASA